MYTPPTGVLGVKIAAGTGALTVLPHTGALALLWLFVAAFTLVMAGTALLNLLPRKRY